MGDITEGRVFNRVENYRIGKGLRKRNGNNNHKRLKIRFENSNGKYRQMLEPMTVFKET